MSATELSSSGGGAGRLPSSRRLTGTAALRLHLALALGLAASAAAFVVEVFRALGGNTLSWVYVAEWPMLAAFGTYMWWSLLTGRDRRGKVRNTHCKDGPAVPEAELAAWRRYVRELEAADEAGDQPS
ncbi:MAG TPA: hypothetical protein VEJ21_04870 [Acidimicrobiales bacterium]|nr:hypothetical protein [Acidimicrobiales bacterium]